ncbi:hypothetical protein ABVV53_16245, partial [Novosphingobium sp. RD2P27]
PPASTRKQSAPRCTSTSSFPSSLPDGSKAPEKSHSKWMKKSGGRQCTTEGSVRQMKATVEHAFAMKNIRRPGRFSLLPPRMVDHTPTYRLSIPELAENVSLLPEPDAACR